MKLPARTATLLFSVLVASATLATDAPKSITDQLKDYPERLAKFVKVSIRQYDDPAGEDVSIGYNYFRSGKEPLVTFTAYFYPLPGAAEGRTLKDHHEDVLREMKKAHPTTKVISSGPITLKQGPDTHEGLKDVVEYRAPFAPNGGEKDLRSEVYLFQLGKRLVKYRISYPLADADTAARHVEAITAEFPWPKS
jgi:hypothetical protein